jgi:hypothetical protein
MTGVSGQTGLQGPTGAQGLTGTIGYTGIQGATGANRHTTLVDMPDSSGIITDHDTRLVAKVQSATPTVPTPFAGMFWYDTTGATPGNTLATTLISNTYTVISSDELIVASSTGYNVYLPSATGTGRLLWVKYIGSGTINVIGNGSDIIDGDSTQSLLQDDDLQIADYASTMWAVL